MPWEASAKHWPKSLSPCSGTEGALCVCTSACPARGRSTLRQCNPHAMHLSRASLIYLCMAAQAGGRVGGGANNILDKSILDPPLRGCAGWRQRRWRVGTLGRPPAATTGRASYMCCPTPGRRCTTRGCGQPTLSSTSACCAVQHGCCALECGGCACCPSPSGVRVRHAAAQLRQLSQARA